MRGQTEIHGKLELSRAHTPVHLASIDFCTEIDL